MKIMGFDSLKGYRATTGLDKESKDNVINQLGNMAGIELQDQLNEAPNLIVVEYTIFGRDPNLISTENPEGEVPGTRETIIVIPKENRPDLPVFVNPGRDKGQRTFGIVNGSDPDSDTHWRIIIVFQEKVVM